MDIKSSAPLPGKEEALTNFFVTRRSAGSVGEAAIT